MSCAALIGNLETKCRQFREVWIIFRARMTVVVVVPFRVCNTSERHAWSFQAVSRPVYTLYRYKIAILMVIPFSWLLLSGCSIHGEEMARHHLRRADENKQSKESEMVESKKSATGLDTSLSLARTRRARCKPERSRLLVNVYPENPRNCYTQPTAVCAVDVTQARVARNGRTPTETVVGANLVREPEWSEARTAPLQRQ